MQRATNPEQVEIDRTVEMRSAHSVIRDDVVEAVKAAFEASIGHLVDERTVHWCAPTISHHVAHFEFRFMEIPAMCVNEDASETAWLPLYRTRELVEEELRDRLPDDVRMEPKNSTVFTLYREE